MRARVRERSDFLQGPRLDMPPKLPFGYGLIRALEEQLPDAMTGLREAGYSLASMEYELVGPTEFHDPERAFRETRVRLDLRPESSGENQSAEPSVEIIADLHLAIPPPRPSDSPVARQLPPRRIRWLLDNVEVEVSGDPALKTLFGKPAEALIGYELLKGSAPSSITDSSRSRSDDPTAPGS
jgi:hypothetical protein